MYIYTPLRESERSASAAEDQVALVVDQEVVHKVGLLPVQSLLVSACSGRQISTTPWRIPQEYCAVQCRCGQVTSVKGVGFSPVKLESWAQHVTHRQFLCLGHSRWRASVLLVEMCTGRGKHFCGVQEAASRSGTARKGNFPVRKKVWLIFFNPSQETVVGWSSLCSIPSSPRYPLCLTKIDPFVHHYTFSSKETTSVYDSGHYIWGETGLQSLHLI